MITTPLSWINGASAFALWISVWVFTIASAAYYRKVRTHPFLTCTLLGLAVALGWTGVFLSFVTNLAGNPNPDWIYNFPRFLTFGVIPIGSMAIIDTTWSIAGNPMHRKQILIGFLVYSLFYYALYYGYVVWTFNPNPALWTSNFPQNIVIVQNASATDTLFDDWVMPTNIFYYALWGQILFATVVSAVGFMKFLKVASGALKKKAIQLLIASLFVGIGILEDLIDFNFFGSLGVVHYDYLWLARLVVIPGVWLFFFGFKPLNIVSRSKT